MLTLWGLISPLVDRLRPAKPVEPAPVVRKRRPRTKPGKPERTPERTQDDAALFAASQAPAAKRTKQGERKQPLALADSPRVKRSPGPAARRVPMQERYDALVKEMLQTYGVRVRKWRTSMSGVAWYVEYRDGTVVRLLESPKPKSPMSLAIFLHEIGHHAIGLGIHKPRCLEEYLAWNYAVTKMEERGFEVTDRVKRRMQRSLKYAVGKAVRRGLRVLPPELEPFR